MWYKDYGVTKPYFADDKVCIIHGDCLVELPKLKNIEIAILDPPYNIGTPQRITFDNYGKESQRRIVGQNFGVFDEGAITPDKWIPLMPNLLVTFYGTKRMIDLLNAVEKNNYEVVQDFHWCKPNPPVPMRSVGFSWGVESGYIIRKLGYKHKHNNDAGISPNWKLEPRCSNNEMLGHPTQKPIEIMRWLVAHWSFPNDIIIDPFMGSGTTLRDAKDLGRKAIGIEINESYCLLASQRMKQSAMELGI